MNAQQQAGFRAQQAQASLPALAQRVAKAVRQADLVAYERLSKKLEKQRDMLEWLASRGR